MTDHDHASAQAAREAASPSWGHPGTRGPAAASRMQTGKTGLENLPAVSDEAKPAPSTSPATCACGPQVGPNPRSLVVDAPSEPACGQRTVPWGQSPTARVQGEPAAGRRDPREGPTQAPALRPHTCTRRPLRGGRPVRGASGARPGLCPSWIAALTARGSPGSRRPTSASRL